jgi:hypothetical protein
MRRARRAPASERIVSFCTAHASAAKVRLLTAARIKLTSAIVALYSRPGARNEAPAPIGQKAQPTTVGGRRRLMGPRMAS